MKKILSNVMALAMVAGLACGAAACGTTKVVEEVDENKVQLYIASYSGGAGYKWLDDPKNEEADDAESRFEKKYANTKFGDKTGVQVIVESSKVFSASKVKDSLTAGSYDMYFAPASYYQHVAAGDFLDITDMVQEVSPVDNKTLEGKIAADKQSLLKVDGKYYALPYFYITQGITYDAGLFNENKLYFSQEMDNDGMRKFVMTVDATNKSCGPDAVYGTYDDGMPSSIQEIYKLMDKMRSGAGGEQILPFAFNGAGTFYTNYLMRAMSANIDGIDAVNIHNKFHSNGTEVKVVTGFDGETPIFDDVVITEENAYLMKSTAGMYYASEFAQRLFSDANNYDSEAAGATSSNLYAMERFLKSGIDGRSTPVGMFIEGSYWYCEANADGVMDRVKKYGTKDLRVMPMPHQYAGTVTPKADGETPISQVLTDELGYAFIAADIPSERLEAAKLFMQFVYSDEELVKAELANEGVQRAVNYDASSIQEKLPGYARSLNTIRAQASANGTICAMGSQNPISIKAGMYFTQENRAGYWTGTVNGETYGDPFKAFSEGKLSTKQYFDMLQISKNIWEQNYLQ